MEAKKGMITRDKLVEDEINWVCRWKGLHPMMHELPLFSKIAFKNGYPWKASSKIKLDMEQEHYQFQKKNQALFGLNI